MIGLAEVINLRATDIEIEEIRRELRRSGIYLRFGRNFFTFRDHIHDQPKRSRILEQFYPEGDMDGAVDAFWVCGFDKDGELVHTQALHLLELKDQTLSQHIKKTLPRYFPSSPKLDRSSIKSRPGPKLTRLSGRVAYHGEMWFHERHRDLGTACLGNRLGMCMAVEQWNPDSIFGLMSWVLACDGFNSRIGYHHTESMTLTFDKLPERTPHQIWAVFMEREDIQFLLDLPAVEMASALRRKFQ